MGLKNIIRNRFVKSNTQTIFRIYLKIKNEELDLNEREILEMLLVLRRPFWNGDFNTITFKSCPAFILQDHTSIDVLIIFINIWECIIGDPKQVNLQHITMHELREMITSTVKKTTEVMVANARSNINLNNTHTIEDFVSFTVDIINRLGGKIL